MRTSLCGTGSTAKFHSMSWWGRGAALPQAPGAHVPTFACCLGAGDRRAQPFGYRGAGGAGAGRRADLDLRFATIP